MIQIISCSATGTSIHPLQICRPTARDSCTAHGGGSNKRTYKLPVCAHSLLSGICAADVTLQHVCWLNQVAPLVLFISLTYKL